MEKKTKTGGRTGAGEEMVVVYSHALKQRYQCTKPDELVELSILVKTETGEVFGRGMNFMEGRTEPNNYTKVGGLERGIKKIVVGQWDCAALTHDGRVMVWEHTSNAPRDPAGYIIFTWYKSDMSCLSCGVGCSAKWGLAYCDRCDMYQPGRYDDDDCWCVSIYQRERSINCDECSEPQTPKRIKTYDLVRNKPIYFIVAGCASCERFLSWSCYPIWKMNHADNNSFTTIIRKNDEQIKDVAFSAHKRYGTYIIVMLLENNNLYLKVPVLKNEYTINIRTNGNSSSGKIEAVYGDGGGGGGQLFVKYEDGSLFKCSLELSWITYVQTDMKLPAAVDKVCCGMYCTAALLSDGSVWFIADECAISRLVHKSGLDVFTDIAMIANTDVYLVQAPTGTTGDGSEMDVTLPTATSLRVVVKFYESALNTVLKEMVPPTTSTEDSSNTPARTLPLPSSNMAQLYGKSHLADMTIKLTDEELPAHSAVLFVSSAHFQKIFNADNPPPKVLDVSHYNPQAYKYLLQYFYQIQPCDLDAEGFAHLRQIAFSYGETQLVDAATAKIRTLLNEDNVERIFTLSKRHDFQDLAVECERIMRSQPFLEKLLQTTMKNLAISEDSTEQ